MFIGAAIVSALAAIQLSIHANKISKHSNMSGFVTGTLLLAVATSLPELTVTISASIINNPDIAIGNGLGSILFNFFVLFAFDIHFRGKRLFLHVSDHHVYSGIISLILGLITAIGLVLHSSIAIMHISFISVLIITVYIVGIKIISKAKSDQNTTTKTEKEPLTQSNKLKYSVTKFILFSVIIFVSGSALSLSGDAMARSTGISSTAIGGILVAMASSIPDAMSVYTALRLANVNLAIGTILGSNMFNILALTIADVFYSKGSIWLDTDNQLVYMSLIGCFLTLMVMLIIKRDHTKNTFTYILPSLIAVVSYFVIVFFVM
ncbi:sodium:calcium antiporter [Aquibacillus koreensis]|uniref:sodium:calcium antiporter n=1 Tax=Aquibacillus koreensis TaxID=279446 RepID=UPI0021A92277|nr:sodium:calcium antiporter [Aquibacillus koreensis]MCT2536901.1 sodium:calcium antiporter [Aquibacillus koreensis]